MTQQEASRPRVRAGSEILFAKRQAKDGLDAVRARDLAGELRERYWIEAAKNVPRTTKRPLFEMSMPWRMERHEIGRTRDQPGDGFRYVFRVGPGGAESSAEWFEVTEVFEGVEPKHVEAFMRVNNGGTAGFDFDPDNFVQGLDMGMPCRAAQRRAADKVIDAVEKKLNKASYEGMWEEHGYGTLIVGLPLWFANPPANPLRANNVIDHFGTRVTVGLESYSGQLAKKSCPFRRIVVIWMRSVESVQEFRDKIDHDAYDAASRMVSGIPLAPDSPFSLLKSLDAMELALTEGAQGSLHVTKASVRKRGEEATPQLSPAVAAVRPELQRLGSELRPGPLERMRWSAIQRATKLLCIVRFFGLSGFERWIFAKLSPNRRLTRWARQQRTSRLYRASRRRQATKSGS